MDIILASASPRRRELIKLISENVKCITADVDETLPDNLSPDFSAEFLACKKALAVAKDNQESLVIGCDTIVLVDTLILGKPKNKEDAFNMLSLLSGRTHKVITGCCLALSGKTLSFSVTSLVTFYNLTEDEINSYINTDEPYDKAGGYAIQGKASLFIEKIDGDYLNIVGLPVAMLNKQIKNILGE